MGEKEIEGIIIGKYTIIEWYPFKLNYFQQSFYETPLIELLIPIKRICYNIRSNNKQYKLVIDKEYELQIGEEIKIRITGKILKRIHLLYKDKKCPMISLNEIA
jgi:hypothetical protein